MNKKLSKFYIPTSFQVEQMRRANRLCKLKPKTIEFCCLHHNDLVLGYRLPTTKKKASELNKLEEMVRDPRLYGEIDLKAGMAYLTIPTIPSVQHLEMN